jgi:uncharacterized protein (TIGR03435 family)
MTTSNVLAGTSLLLLLAGAGFGQTPATQLSFEVASVKPASPQQWTKMRSTRDGIDFQGVTLRICIVDAYRVKPFQVSAPGWMDDLKYDIVAKASKAVSSAQWSQMLQTLLAERFKLQIHREQKEFSGYALVVGAGGPKLTKSVEDGSGSMTVRGIGQIPSQPILMTQLLPGGGVRLIGEHVTMAHLVAQLSIMLGSPVVDLTNAPGNYDFVLDASQEDIRDGDAVRIIGGDPASANLEAPPPGMSIFTSIQTLGLKLKRQKVPLDVIVVDQAEKVPVGN